MKWDRGNTIVAAISGAIATTALIVSCGASSGTPQFDDLQNVPILYPDSAQAYMDLDGMPNIVRECIGGVGFALTTRTGAGAWREIPEWAGYCKSQEGSNFSRTGHP